MSCQPIKYPAAEEPSAEGVRPRRDQSASLFTPCSRDRLIAAGTAGDRYQQEGAKTEAERPETKPDGLLGIALKWLIT